MSQDGRASVDRIAASFAARFAPRRLEPGQLQGFLYRLHQEGLVLSAGPGQGAELLARGRRRRRWTSLDAWTDLLALRFRGIDPDPLLRRLECGCGWLFSRGCCTAVLLAAAVMAGVVAAGFDGFRARLPGLSTLLTAEGLLGLALAMALVKVLHELGHGLACRRFGGECHELGLMLLVFTPCLYCDVSDTWMVASRWRRMAVSAAGIYVEIILAVICTMLWWTTGSGALQSFCFSVMVLCSANTLLVNGNPLLRYDGYYVLADLMELPNLAEQARTVLYHYLAKTCLGLDLYHDRQLPRHGRGFLLVYAVLSLAYRVAVVAAVLWVLHLVLRPLGFAMAVWLMALTLAAKMLVAPVGTAWAVLSDPQRRERIRGGRVLRTCVLLAAVFGGLWAPLPRHVRAPAVMSPCGAAAVYVTVPGRLVEGVRVGQSVSAGTPLARLENPDLELTLARLRGERGRQRCRLRYLEMHRAEQPQLAAQIPATREALAEVEQELRQREHERDQLILAAPCDGTVLPPPGRRAPEVVAGELPPAEGVRLDERDRGTWLPTGTLYCRVGSPSRLEAILHVEQNDVDLVEVGQRVRIVPDQRRGDLLDGTLEEIGQVEQPHGDRPETEARRNPGGWKPIEPGNRVNYQARVRFAGPPPRLSIASGGRAKIAVAPQSLAVRAYRSLCGLLHF